MKVTFNTEELQKVLSQLGAVVAKKATSPVYEHVRLEVQPSTDSNVFAVSLAATDIDASLLRYFAKASADGAVVALLPFSRLQELTANASAAETIVEIEDETKAILRQGKGKAVIKTYPVQDWPPQIERPAAITARVGLPGFKDQLSKVEFAVPTETNKFVVAVAKIDSTPETLTVVATDGFRLAISTTKQNAGTFSLTMPKTALDRIKKLEGTELSILETEAGFYFETELEILTVTRVAGTFPPYERILPKGHVTEIVVEKGAFQDAFKFVRPQADKATPVIKFSVTENGTAVFMLAQSADATTVDVAAGMFTNTGEDEVDAKVTGPAATFPLNAAYLADFIERASGPLVVYIGAGPAAIVDFRANGDAYRYLQMPAQ